MKSKRFVAKQSVLDWTMNLCSALDICVVTADEIAGVAELLLGSQGTFSIGADFLIDGGATVAYFYGSLSPEK